jgi:hypothetical protein
MKLPGIEWDEEKNTANMRKHSGLSFEVAQYPFPILKGWNAWTGAKGTRPGKNAGKPWGKWGLFFSWSIQRAGKTSG